KRKIAHNEFHTDKVTIEIVMFVQVNHKTAKIDVLRQQIFRWWISGIRKQDIGIDRPSDPNQFLHKFHDSTAAEPADHRARSFIADEITEDCTVTCVRTYRNADGFGNLFAGRSFAQKLDMFCPRKRHKNAHPGSGATIKKPARRRMVYP